MYVWYVWGWEKKRKGWLIDGIFALLPEKEKEKVVGKRGKGEGGK